MSKIFNRIKSKISEFYSFDGLSVIIIIVYVFVFISLVCEYNSTTKDSAKKCREEAEAMNLGYDFVNDKCVYILPDETRVLSNKYFVVNIPYIVDME